MKRVLKWVYINKRPISGIVSVSLYFLDSLFKISEKLCLPEGWYYTIVTALFLIISYTINGKKFVGLKFIEELIETEKQLKNNEILKELDKINDEILKSNNK